MKNVSPSASSSSWQARLPWVLLVLVLAAVGLYHYGPGEALSSRTLQQTLETSSVVVITAIDRTGQPDRPAQDYFVRLDADTWYQFKSDPATTTRFVFKQTALEGDKMTLRDGSRGVEITLNFDFAKKTVVYRQANQPDGYELFSIVALQALPK